MRNRSIASALGMFVLCLSAFGQQTWAPCTAVPVQVPLLCVSYGNGMFVAAGKLGTIITSPDGTAWTARNSGTKASLNAITFGNDRFMAVGDSGRVLVSTDGVTWIDRSLPDSLNKIGSLNTVCFGDGRFVVGGYMTPITSKDNGNTWVSNSSLDVIITYLSYYASSYWNGRYLLAGNRSSLFATTTFDTYDTLRGNFQQGIPHSYTSTNRGLAFSDNALILVGEGPAGFPRSGGIYVSTDGVAWTNNLVYPAPPLYAACYGNGHFVAVGDSGSIFSSSDADSWTRQESPCRYRLWGVTCGNNTFVAVGDSGTVLCSPALLPAGTQEGKQPYKSAGIQLLSKRIVRFTTNSHGRVVAQVFALNGRKVMLLVDKVFAPGTYDISLPNSLPAGSYCFSLRTGGTVMNWKIALSGCQTPTGYQIGH